MRLFALILGALLLSSPAFAQPLDEPPPDEEEPSAPERERMHERVRMMRMYALTEALALDEATAAKLFPYLRKGDEAMEALHDQKRTFKQELRQMAKAEVYDDAAVKKAIAGISDVDVSIAQERSAQLRGLGAILSSEQQVKFLLVRARFEGEVRDMIRDERKRERGDRRRGRDDDRRDDD